MKQQTIVEKNDLIKFLKKILPYWESDDLDDYMYVVHHYDLERVATNIQDLIEQAVKERDVEIKKELLKKKREEPTNEPFANPRRKAIRSVNKVVDDIIIFLNK